MKMLRYYNLSEKVWKTGLHIIYAGCSVEMKKKKKFLNHWMANTKIRMEKYRYTISHSPRILYFEKVQHDSPGKTVRS